MLEVWYSLATGKNASLLIFSWYWAHQKSNFFYSRGPSIHYWNHSSPFHGLKWLGGQILHFNSMDFERYVKKYKPLDPIFWTLDCPQFIFIKPLFISDSVPNSVKPAAPHQIGTDLIIIQQWKILQLQLRERTKIETYSSHSLFSKNSLVDKSIDCIFSWKYLCTLQKIQKGKRCWCCLRIIDLYQYIFFFYQEMWSARAGLLASVAGVGSFHTLCSVIIIISIYSSIHHR